MQELHVCHKNFPEILAKLLGLKFVICSLFLQEYWNLCKFGQNSEILANCIKSKFP